MRKHRIKPTLVMVLFLFEIMASCEKCWNDSFSRSYEHPYKGQTEHYHDLINERKDNPCTPEEQAGDDAKECPKCKRKTVHQHAKVCTICGYK